MTLMFTLFYIYFSYLSVIFRKRENKSQKYRDYNEYEAIRNKLTNYRPKYAKQNFFANLSKTNPQVSVFGVTVKFVLVR